MPTKYTIAFAGSGVSTYENTRDLLNDFLGFGPDDADGFPTYDGDPDIEVILPLSDSHVTESVMGVFTYTEYADLDYHLYASKDADRSSKDAEDLIEYARQVYDLDSVNSSIVTHLELAQENGREAYLFLFWGEEGDENSEKLLDLASSAGIKVKDMTAGLDDLAFADEAPAPEPEPEPEERPRRRRGRARAAEQQAEEQVQQEVKDTEPKAEVVKAREAAKERRTRGRARANEVTKEPLAAESDTSPEEQLAEIEKVKAEEETKRLEKIAAEAEAQQRDLTVPEVEEFEKAYDQYQASTEHQAAKTRLAVLDAAYAKYVAVINSNLPDSREKSLALTNVEQGHLWAVSCLGKHIANLPEPKAEDVGDQIAKAVKAEARRGRGRPRNDGQDPQPRTALDKAKTEIWDEDEEKWKPKGRGRIPKGAKTRKVDPETGDVLQED